MQSEEDICVKKLNLKRCFSLFIAFVLTLGLIWNGNTAKAATSTTLEFVSGSYSDEKQIYVVNVKSPDMETLETIGTVEGNVLVNGISTTVKWEGYSSPSYYQLLIPYNTVYSTEATTHALKRGASYVTIKAGTTIGNITVSEDFHVKVHGKKGTSNTHLVEQVSEVPDYFCQYWNSNASNVILGFNCTTGVPMSSISSTSGTVYVDGKAVTGTWASETTYSSYTFTMSHGKLGESSATYANTHIVRVPAETKVGDMVLSQDIYIKMTTDVKEELTPAQVSLAAGSSYNDDNSQYVIHLAPNDGKTIITPGASSTSVLIDGVEVENAISSWDKGSDNYGACIKYSAIESDATAASDVGEHTITFPSGTYVGNRILTEDFSVRINGTSKIRTESKVSLEEASSYQDNEGKKRYVFWLKPTDGRAIVDSVQGSNTIYVDDKKVTSGVSWVDTDDVSGYALAVNYSAIQANATVSTDVGEHIIRIPKGTYVADLVFAEDVWIKVDGRSISVYKPPVTMSMTSSGYQDGNNGNYRYIFYLTPDDGREIVAIGSPSNTILVDGKEVSQGISWLATTSSSTSYGLCVKYDAIVSGVQSASQIGEHVLTVPKGTVVGDVKLAENLYIKVNNTTRTELTPVTLQHTETVCGIDTYQMQFTVEGVTSAITNISNAEVFVDGEVTNEATYNFGGNDENGYYIQLFLPYSAVQSGANTAAEVTETHTIQIGKGALLSDMVLKEDVDVLVKGESVT